MPIPTLRVHGPTATFVDGLTDERYSEVELVMLGLCKQRVLWPPEMSEDKRPPLCRSLDALTGTPDLDAFPWKAAAFNAKTFITVVEDDDTGQDVKTLTQPLPCESCKLRQWGTHPKNTQAPWCTEQYVFAVLLKRETDEGELWTPATLPLARSGVKPAQQYCTAYKLKQSPMFVDYTRLKLKPMERGTVKYAVPIFERLGPTDKGDRPYYTDQFYKIRAFLQTPRGREQIEDADGPVPTVPAQRGNSAVASYDEEPF